MVILKINANTVSSLKRPACWEKENHSCWHCWLQIKQLDKTHWWGKKTCQIKLIFLDLSTASDIIYQFKNKIMNFVRPDLKQEITTVLNTSSSFLKSKSKQQTCVYGFSHTFLDQKYIIDSLDIYLCYYSHEFGISVQEQYIWKLKPLFLCICFNQIQDTFFNPQIKRLCV